MNKHQRKRRKLVLTSLLLATSCSSYSVVDGSLLKQHRVKRGVRKVPYQPKQQTRSTTSSSIIILFALFQVQVLRGIT